MSTSTRRKHLKSHTTAESPASTVSHRYQPYNPNRTEDLSKRVKRAKWPRGYTPPPSLPLNEEVPKERPTMREVSLGLLQKLYPGITPRDDLDIMYLSHGAYHGPLSNKAVYEFLDTMIEAESRTFHGAYPAHEQGREGFLSRAKIYLDKHAEVTGLKPYPGQRNVFVRPIPDSDYSIRLWPGVAANREFCLDFVHTATGEATNSPFAYELWSIPDPDAPLLSMGPMRLTSLENNFGVKTRDIRPGEERFVLKEGLTCMLARPGKRGLRFTVPIVKREPPSAVEAFDVLDLPKFVG